jgi:hypothetical protein
MQELVRSGLLDRIGALAVLLLVAARLPAQTTPPPIDPALRSRLGFLGPESVKIGDDIDMLSVGDLDGDGRAEVLVHDGARGHVERISRDASGSIQRTSIDTRGTLRGLRAAVLVPGKPRSIVALRADGRLVIGLGEERPREIEVGAPVTGNALRVADLDGDGRDEALVMTRDGVRCVHGLSDAPALQPPIELGEGQANSFLVQDVDGDARVDLVIGANSEALGLRVARGDGAFGFAPWLGFGAERVVGVFPGPKLREQPALLVLLGPRRRLAVLDLVPAASGEAVQFLALPATKRPAFPFAQGDVDGDGDVDLVLANPERAELVYLLEDRGRFLQRVVPSFAGISSLAIGDIDRDGKQDILLASPSEKALAVRNGATPLDEFPTRVAHGTLDPVTVGIGPAGELYCVGRDRSRAAALHHVTYPAKPVGSAVSIVELGKLNGEPLRLSVGDFDAAPGADLALVLPGEGLRIFSGNGKGGFVAFDPKTESGGPGFAERIDDGAFGVVDGGDSAPQLLVVRERFARFFRLDAARQPIILKQRNLPPSADSLELGGMLPGGVLAAVERKANRLHLMPADSPARSIALPPVGPTHVLAHGDDVLVLGTAGVVRIRRGESFEARERVARDAPTDESRFFAAVAADLDHDGAEDVAVLDSDLHGVQIYLAPGIDRALAFPVFEDEDADADLREPREVAAGDIDGDGRADLVLCAFDRVLIYLQEPAK